MSTRDRLHVGVDARCLNTTHVRGMGKYVAEMMAHGPREEVIQWTLYGDRPEEPFHAPAGTPARIELFDFKGYRFHTWEQVGLPWRSSRAGVDVLHCTATTLPWWQPVPTVVTLHDTLPWQGDRAPSDAWYLDRLTPAALRKCRAVITISEASRRDIVALWPWLEPKLHVIPHGVGDSYFAVPDEKSAETLRAQTEGHPYLLYIGGALERKRFAWAARIIEALQEPQLRLLVCGFAKGEAERARDSLPPAVRERIHFLPFVSEAEMPAYYRNAVAVLYPTLYEGFGFPAVEAQAVGTPVVFSALGSLQELQGPSSEVLPAEDLDAWLQCLRRLLHERAANPVPNELARQWARQFSWDVSALKHREVYREAARPR